MRRNWTTSLPVGRCNGRVRRRRRSRRGRTCRWFGWTCRRRGSGGNAFLLDQPCQAVRQAVGAVYGQTGFMPKRGLRALKHCSSRPLDGGVLSRRRQPKQIAAYAGLAPTPWQSGEVNCEQGVSKSGNPRLRTTLIQLAWLWLRHQPQSALALWFKERVTRRAVASSKRPSSHWRASCWWRFGSM